MSITHIRIEDAELTTAIVWDVRDEKSYREGHVTNAVNVPLDSITLEQLHSIDPTQPIYVLCGGGTKAGRAIALLESIDAKREYVELKGGTRAAKAAGMPIETSNG